MLARMFDRLEGLNDEWAPRFGLKEPLRLRIGINSGPAAVGSLGKRHTFEFTAVGNTVNVASRLEGLAEPGSVVVSDAVFIHLGQIDATDLGERSLKNVPEPVRCWAVSG